ncbi:MAG: hypothetical protein ABIP33_10535 [Pseudolysinimonas sp.]
MPRHPLARSRIALVAVTATTAVLLLAGCTPAHKNPVATFEVAGVETYKIELVTPALLKHAEQLLKGEHVAAIPLGRVVRDSPGVNKPWSWHIDPTTLEFAQITIEVCDGLPSYVEDHTVTSPDYCPWSAKVIKIDK